MFWKLTRKRHLSYCWFLSLNLWVSVNQNRTRILFDVFLCDFPICRTPTILLKCPYVLSFFVQKWDNIIKRWHELNCNETLVARRVSLIIYWGEGFMKQQNCNITTSQQKSTFRMLSMTIKLEMFVCLSVSSWLPWWLIHEIFTFTYILMTLKKKFALENVMITMSYPSDHFSNDSVPGSIRLSVSKLSFINRNKSESESNDWGQFVHQIHNETFVQSIHVHDVVWCRVVHPFQHSVGFNLKKCKKCLSGICLICWLFWSQLSNWFDCPPNLGEMP